VPKLKENDMRWNSILKKLSLNDFYIIFHLSVYFSVFEVSWREIFVYFDGSFYFNGRAKGLKSRCTDCWTISRSGNEEETFKVKLKALKKIWLEVTILDENNENFSRWNKFFIFWIKFKFYKILSQIIIVMWK
jgi:hypothetical protein